MFFVFDASPPLLFFPPFLFFFSSSSLSSSSEVSVSESVVVSVDEDDVDGDLLLLFFVFRLLPCFFPFFPFFSFFFLFFSSFAKSLQSMFRSENASRTLFMLLVPVGGWDCCNKSVSWLVCLWGWELMAGSWFNEFNLVCLFVFVCFFVSVCLSCLFVCFYVCFLTAIEFGGRGRHLVLHGCQIRWLLTSSSASAKTAPEAVAVPVDLHRAVGMDRVCLWECSFCVYLF